ncbi:hypothetical protein Lal_00025841 [Lupinus albus]|uniref:Putative triacylglycerol lipase n=1 Tax=Lupinus albus TaxID=3870 RepID=A0A6A4PZL2_LUPAL|nr:putative triacylglycerol lipase [Lupinus albus]KAF1861496.1 hypothetical protein Lal_00025841 [Lupinus albus]
MVNVIKSYWSLLHWLMKKVGVTPCTVEIEPGTVMRFWVPSETVSKKPKVVSKPVVVLLHGFCGDGIMNWQLQINALTKRYAVYVPDLLFFGGSITDKPDRSPAFQAECLAVGLRKLGVEKCSVVGFSYGGMVGFKMAELYPELVEAVMVSGTVVAMKESIIMNIVKGLGFSSSSEMLMPTTANGIKDLLSMGTHKKIWFPHRFHKDFLEIMFENRKERAELLEGLDISYKDVYIPKFQQRMHLLWGENDKIFKLKLGENMKEQLGEKATIETIKRAGHLVHLERPCVYNRSLKHFLSSIYPDTKN